MEYRRYREEIAVPGVGGSTAPAMSQPTNKPEPDRRLLAELSALSDGSLDPGRAEAVKELISASPELQERYRRERLAVRATHELRNDFAPASLRSAVATGRRRVARRRARLLYGGTLSGAVAAAVILLVLLLPGGSPGSPSVSQAADLALRGPVSPAPAIDRAQPAKLDQDVQEVYFPNWARFRYSAVGKRTDRLGGRAAITVYYRWGSQLVAYTILTGPPLSWPRRRIETFSGMRLASFVHDGRLVITWRRRAHTCVLSGAGVSAAELAKLASWGAPGLEK